ncbi:aprataxin and PNK-like factor [Drosophila tropicalis]|uniref:aprataxin and PNK-like factor n=1 Tax=Drosophila tropicalis TaxID=46794 RepID=UPI0035ABEFD1
MFIMSAVSDEQQQEEAVGTKKESVTTNQDETIKRKLPEIEMAGDAGVFSEASPTKRIKTEPIECEAEPVVNSIKLESNVEAVKTEPTDENPPPAASVSSNSSLTVKAESADTSVTSPVVVKAEPTQSNGEATANNASAVVSSSTIRPSCRFGIRCYRRNPAHRSAEAHPGDDDYRRPDYPEPPLGTPACPFGNLCYRRNPVHFQQHSHPPDFDSAQNIRNRLRQRRRVQQQQNDPDSDLNSEDDEDPFGGDSDKDEEYRPGANFDDDDDDDDDEELEFDSQRVNCDQYD